MKTIFNAIFNEPIDLSETKKSLVEEEQEMMLAATGTTVTGTPDPKTQKSHPESGRMIIDNPIELETAFYKVSDFFNGINKITQLIMSANPHLESKDKSAVDYFENPETGFFNKIGTTGTDITWDDLLETTIKHNCIFGWAWNELIFNKTGSKIVDWDIIDPKSMDYAKDSTGNLVLDNLMRTVGYVQKVPYNVTVTQIDKAPEKVFLSNNWLFIKPERIALFKLYTFGDGFYPIGLIEPGYLSAKRRLNVEKSMANFIYDRGFGKRVAYVGDPQHEPTPQLIQHTLDKMAHAKFSDHEAYPHYVKQEILQTSNAEKVGETLDYYKNDAVTVMGGPKPLITGIGDDTNRATLGDQIAIFETSLNAIATKLASQITKYMLAPTCAKNGIKTVPKFKFDNISVGLNEERASRLLEYIKAGIFFPGLSTAIQKMEKLPVVPFDLTNSITETKGESTKKKGAEEKDGEPTGNRNRNKKD